jgi:Tfp pilus assembly protein PilV
MDDKYCVLVLIEKFSRRNKGFTVIEALVAITILLLGVLGPLSVATRGITDGMIAKNQIVALGLAQEGVELIRAKIDSNLNNSNLWLTGLDSCLNSASPPTCRVLATSNEYESCDLSAGTCDLRSGSNGIYVVTGGTGQIFSREIQVAVTPATSPLVSDVEAKITIKVGWWNKNQHRDVTLNTYVYNPLPL